MTAFSARLLPEVNAVPALVAYVVALLALPSALIVAPLGSAGTPAQIIAFGLFAWWLASRVVARLPPTRTNPVKWLVAIFAIAVLASYVVGMSRPIAYAVEVNSADRYLLSLCAWCGVVLVLADGIGSYRQLSSLLRVVAGSVTLIGVLGMLQFAFQIDIAGLVHIPGLTYNHEFGELSSRSRFNRVNGTTTHPIEFGVVLSCALPLVIHFARFSETRMQRFRWSAAVGIVLVALPMSVARSAALGGFIAIAFLFFTWPSRVRVRAVILGVTGSLAMSVVVPGLLGTIRGLFFNASSDPSTQGRTADYGPVLKYFGSHPIFGRGFGTFIPSLYRTLDNAYLGVLVECGLFGLLALVALFVGTATVAVIVRRRSRSASVRDLAQSLLAGIMVLAVNAATFDALGFTMCAGMIFVLLGSTAALWSIESSHWAPKSSPTTPGSNTWFRLGAAILCVTFLVSAVEVKSSRPEYFSYGTILIVPPPTKGEPAFVTASDTAYTASALLDVMQSQAVRETLRGKGVSEFEMSLQDGSLERGSDVVGTLTSTLYIKTEASTPPSAARSMATVVAESRARLFKLQSQVGVSANNMIQVNVLQETAPYPVRGRRSRAYVGFALLFTVVFGAYWQVARRRRGFFQETQRAQAGLLEAQSSITLNLTEGSASNSPTSRLRVRT